MNSPQDALYQLHQLEAARLGYVPLPYERFCAKLDKTSDITGMLLPPSALNIKIREKHTNGLIPVRVYITSAAAAEVPADEVRKAIERHAAGDWGLVSKEPRSKLRGIEDGFGETGTCEASFAVSNRKERHDEKEWRRNDLALRNGKRLFSVYEASNGRKFCIITRADRAVTKVLLPET